MAVGELIFTISYGGIVMVLGLIMKIFIKKTYNSIYKSDSEKEAYSNNLLISKEHESNV